jgi:hypothetical protein
MLPVLIILLPFVLADAAMHMDIKSAPDQTVICLDEECLQVLSVEVVPKHTSFLKSPLHGLFKEPGEEEEEEEDSSVTQDAKEWFFSKVV